MYKNGLANLIILNFTIGCYTFHLSYLDITQNVDIQRETGAFQKIDSFVGELKAEAKYIKNTRERE